VRFEQTEFELIKEMLHAYTWAERIMYTKLDIIHESLQKKDDLCPISHIHGRIKTTESIADKLAKLGFELTAKNAKEQIKDIAGIRIICPYAKDIVFMVDMLKELPDCEVVSEKDYVTNPKQSGYRSYHIIIDVPVFHSGKTEKLPIEVQLRTEAMNFWATLEHQVKYKYKNQIPQHLSDELIVCADKISELDNRMYLIHEIISLINEE